MVSNVSPACRVRAVCLAAYDHPDLPFELLVDELQLRRGLSHTPLFQIVFVLQNALIPAVELDRLTVRPLAIEPAAAKFDLVVDLAERAEGIAGAFKYNADLFDAAAMARMTELFIITLDLVVQRPGAPLHTLVEQLDTIDLHHRISQIHTVRAAETQKLKGRRKTITG